MQNLVIRRILQLFTSYAPPVCVLHKCICSLVANKSYHHLRRHLTQVSRRVCLRVEHMCRLFPIATCDVSQVIWPYQPTRADTAIGKSSDRLIAPDQPTRADTAQQSAQSPDRKSLSQNNNNKTCNDCCCGNSSNCNSQQDAGQESRRDLKQLFHSSKTGGHEHAALSGRATLYTIPEVQVVSGYTRAAEAPTPTPCKCAYPAPALIFAPAFNGPPALMPALTKPPNPPSGCD